MGVFVPFFSYIHDIAFPKFKTRVSICMGSNQFKPNAGVAQGSIISPYLFDIYIEDLFTQICSQKNNKSIMNSKHLENMHAFETPEPLALFKSLQEGSNKEETRIERKIKMFERVDKLVKSLQKFISD